MGNIKFTIADDDDIGNEPICPSSEPTGTSFFRCKIGGVSHGGIWNKGICNEGTYVGGVSERNRCNASK